MSRGQTALVRLAILVIVALLLLWVMSHSPSERKKTGPSPPPPIGAVDDQPAVTTGSTVETAGPASRGSIEFYEAENGCSYVVIPGVDEKPDTLEHSGLCPRCVGLKQ